MSVTWPQGKSPGPTYIMPPPPPPAKAASWTHLGPKLRSIICQVSGPGATDQNPAEGIRPLRDRSGPARRIRAPRDESGPARQIRSPLDQPGPRKTNQDPAGRIRTPQDESEPRKTNQGTTARITTPQDESGSRKTNEGSAGRIRARGTISRPSGTKQDPARRIRAPQDESGSHRTNQGPAGRSPAPSRGVRSPPSPDKMSQGPAGLIRARRPKSEIQKCLGGLFQKCQTDEKMVPMHVHIPIGRKESSCHFLTFLILLPTEVEEFRHE